MPEIRSMTPQNSIAHYRITAKLGEGGMGEVWRATDTKLNREVAIKILPEAFWHDADRMARFEREAQVLASLNHPNIAVIHGVEERALIMELVEGPTLAERIAQGPLTVEEFLPILDQLVDALDYAHEKGVVHRDLKPGNIKLTPEGRLKVLDFGLAKVVCVDAQAELCTTASPTLTMRATMAGAFMGTAAYMSPEQALGHSVDKRTDIWAFGVVVYEMLTGRRPLGGSSISETVAAVLKEAPDLERVPASMRRLVRACLVKDVRLRMRDIGDARVLLNEEKSAAPLVPLRRNATPWIAAAAVLAIVAAVAAALLWRATRPVDHPLIRLSVDLGPEAMAGFDVTAAISPDGRRLVFPALGTDGKQQLATRLLDQARPTLLPGTEGGRDPFFSPDGQTIGFFSGRQLKKISVQGDAPVSLSSVTGDVGPGGSWGGDGNIVASLGILGPLWTLHSDGGKRQFLTKLGSGEITHRWPQILPGAAAILFTASASATGMDNANISAMSLKTGEVKIVQRGGYFGRYLPSGHLVYVHQGVLFGERFDPDTLEVRSLPVQLLDDVAANPVNGGGQFDFSSTGTFVYMAGKGPAQKWQVSWLDSSGKMQLAIAAPGAYANPRLSPDQRKLALIVNGDIYVYDLERDTPTRLTFTVGSDVSGHAAVNGAGTPVWAADHKHVLFASVSGLFWMRSDGVGDPELLLESPNSPRPYSVSPDGRRLAYFERNPETGFDIWTLPLDLTDPDHPKPGKPEPFLRTPADELLPKFSPDRRWIAYRSNQTGIDEIHVRPFPAGSGSGWQISTGGGLYAFWSNNGHELFYQTTDNRIMVVDYAVDGASFRAGKPRLWSDKRLFHIGTANLDLAPDGKRFVVFSLPESAPREKSSVHVTMLLNFFEELKRKLP